MTVCGSSFGSSSIDLNTMKVFVAVILALGSASALGSGPYLPSGWRPQGPAFFLPGEVQKPADSPVKETLLFETEASGTDGLREYGPPKVSDNLISQGLPDVATEQTFLVVEDQGVVSVVVAEAVASEENVEQKSDIVVEATTESQVAEEQTTAIYSRIADIGLQTDVTTTYAEEVKSEYTEATVATVEENQEVEEKKLEEVVEEKLEQIVVEEVKAVDQGVKNIAEALGNLEAEIKAEQVQSEAVTEIKINQEGSGSAQVPEGFLEYGPPGFREYGPPKGDELLRTAAVIQEPASNSVSSDSNDARRRRFSPKFKAPPKGKNIR